MQPSNQGLALAIIGLILFLLSLFILLLVFDQYLISLLLMFISVVMIAVGYANTKKVDSEVQT